MTLFEKLDEAKTIGLNEGIAIGEERGRIIGEERGSMQKAYETAKIMLFDGFSFEIISKYTSLSIEQLEELAERI